MTINRILPNGSSECRLPAVLSADNIESTGDATDPKVDAYASLKYFQSIAGHVNDLKRERGASSYYTIAVWFDKYARRIDRLPILHVDKDLVDYGRRTVSQLRTCVEAIRGSGIRSGARSAQVTGAGYDSDGYGYAPYALFSSASPASRAEAQAGAVEQERRAIRAQAAACTCSLPDRPSTTRALVTKLERCSTPQAAPKNRSVPSVGRHNSPA